MLRLLLILLFMLTTQTHNKRIIEIYTTNAQNPRYLEQLKWLEQDKPGLQERDLVIMKYVQDNSNAARFKAKHISGEFTLVLIGKDGGEKFRSKTPVTTKKLFAIIDVMPMRRDEMRAKKDK